MTVFFIAFLLGGLKMANLFLYGAVRNLVQGILGSGMKTLFFNSLLVTRLLIGLQVLLCASSFYFFTWRPTFSYIILFFFPKWGWGMCPLFIMPAAPLSIASV